MKQIKILILLVANIIVSNVYAQVGAINGTVINKTTQLPIKGATISIANTNNGAISDSSGSFFINNIKVGTYNVLITAVGFKPFNLYNVIVNSGNQQVFNIELDIQIKSESDVVVIANKKTVKAASLETPLSVQRLTAEEIKSNPGGNFDISKVIQTLPGVGGGQQGGSFRNDIIIRGGAPNENVFYLDGIEVPVINHFQTQGSSGGPQGILNVSFIEDVKLTTSAFDARYDNALSSVFQFKQRNGNPNKLQGNFRLSATEAALTLDGPLSKDKKTTFLASVRRSYLQLLFKLIDLPIRPNYWDFQTKVTRKINNKTTLTFLGIGAIDDFKFAATKDASPEKLYVINSNVLVNQWNYTIGANLRKSINKGFWNLALSQTNFNNDIEKYEDNENPTNANKTLDITSAEIETKLRFDVNKTINKWRIAYGASSQLVSYQNNSFAIIKKAIPPTQSAIISNFASPLKPFIKLGAFIQIGKRFFDNRLGVSGGLRTDMNSFTKNGLNPLSTMSPRISASYTLANKWTWNTSVGSYYKLPPYTILGYANNANVAVNKNIKYLQSNHITSGFEYVPNDGLRYTIEGFYKKYSNVPISVRNGIALSNLGTDFTLLGNEAVTTNGNGKTYGLEFFVQKKLVSRFFGIFSYTFYRSFYTNINSVFIPSSWDNRHLLSTTLGYKLKRNWEIGIKFRYQGGAPFTPFDEMQSRLNYLSQGVGSLNYSLLNSNRLSAFNSSDIRIDKKWNFKNTTIDFFIDITNWYAAKNPAIPEYTFKRLADNSGFATTDNLPIQPNGSNAIPTFVNDNSSLVTPTIGLVVEF
jgi:hypothetical protein